MTFEDDVDATGRYKSNPYTQDVSRAKDNRTFQQSPLLRVDHEDPALHYIGEGLPIPGETEATWAGRETSVGTSPVPARADHSHDTYLRYCAANNPGGVTCPPGNTNLTMSFADGENYLVSSSLMLLPQAGVWLVTYNLHITRDGGGAFANEVNAVNYYVNGTAARGVWRDHITGLPTLNYFSIADVVFYDDFFVSTGQSTVQVQYQHNDVVNHQVAILSFVVMRLANAEIN